MDDTKSLFASRTVWANIVGLLALILPHLGFDVSTLDQAKLIDAVSAIIASLSFIASSAFRVMASKAIS